MMPKARAIKDLVGAIKRMGWDVAVHDSGDGLVAGTAEFVGVAADPEGFWGPELEEIAAKGEIAAAFGVPVDAIDEVGPTVYETCKRGNPCGVRREMVEAGGGVRDLPVEPDLASGLAIPESPQKAAVGPDEGLVAPKEGAENHGEVPSAPKSKIAGRILGAVNGKPVGMLSQVPGEGD